MHLYLKPRKGASTPWPTSTCINTQTLCRWQRHSTSKTRELFGMKKRDVSGGISCRRFVTPSSC
ncbi:unnamed protein product [Lepidochelys kempii]